MAIKKVKNIKIRTFITIAGLLLFWLLIVAKLFFIQVLNRKQYQNASRNQSREKVKIKPVRGNFYDRKKRKLTSNIELYSIGINPARLESHSRYPKFLARHFDFNINRNAIRQKKSQIIWAAKDTLLPQNVVDSLRFYRSAIKQRKIKRIYNSGKSTSTLLGDVSSPGKGIYGLEETLNNNLSGTPGWKIIERDGWGRRRSMRNLPLKKPQDGSDITLTINQNYQNILFDEIKKIRNKYKADNAKGIIINPNTGEILAMTSCPAFNPNNSSNYIPGSQKNRVITDIYEPGSTFKIVTATAALESGHVSIQDTFDCSGGEIEIQGRTIHDHEKYGKLSFKKVIQHSSNIGSIMAAQRAGKNRLFRYTTKYGFGKKSNINLPGEEEGILPPRYNWTDLRTAQISMGQGISCTVLQLAYAYGAVANGGKLMKPLIVKKSVSPDGKVQFRSEPKVRRRVASKKTMKKLRKILQGVVEFGTGTKAFIRGMSIAGKTGTSQIPTKHGYSHSKFIASFAGFFPASNPHLVSVIVVDNPKGAIYYGGYVAAPAVKNVFKKIVNASEDVFFKNIPARPSNKNQKSQYIHKNLNNRSNNKSQTNELVSLNNVSRVQAVNSTPAKYYKMPDLKGYSASRAIGALQRLGLEVKIKGSGSVVSQYPHPGQKVKRGNKCILNLSP